MTLTATLSDVTGLANLLKSVAIQTVSVTSLPAASTWFIVTLFHADSCPGMTLYASTAFFFPHSMPSSSHQVRDWRSSPSSTAPFRPTPISTRTCSIRITFKYSEVTTARRRRRTTVIAARGLRSEPKPKPLTTSKVNTPKPSRLPTLPIRSTVKIRPHRLRCQIRLATAGLQLSTWNLCIGNKPVELMTSRTAYRSRSTSRRGYLVSTFSEAWGLRGPTAMRQPAVT